MSDVSDAQAKLRAKEYNYTEMWVHVLLTFFLTIIWVPIWVYKTTKAVNKLDHSTERTPTGAMLLYMFIPFYWVFWQYTIANMLDDHAATHGENADNGAIVLVFAFFLPIVNIFLIQHRLNREALWQTRNVQIPGGDTPTAPVKQSTLPGGNAFEMPSLVLAAQNGVIVPVDKTMMLIGRSQECDIHFREDATDVSRRHCRIEKQGNGLLLTDLGSTCGTFLRGERLPPNVPVSLRKGDTFTLGKANHSFTVG